MKRAAGCPTALKTGVIETKNPSNPLLRLLLRYDLSFVGGRDAGGGRDGTPGPESYVDVGRLVVQAAGLADHFDKLLELGNRGGKGY